MNSTLPRPITQEEIDTFDRDGVLLLPKMFDNDWVERMRKAIEDAMGQGEHFSKMNPEGTEGLFYYNLYVWTFNDDFKALAFESPAAEIAATLSGASKINLISDVIFHKEPQSHHNTPWHQDQPYWFIDGWQAIGMWISLDSVTPESGAVEYLRGSHRWGKWYDPANFDATGTLEEFSGTESEALRKQIEAKGRDGFDQMPDIDSKRDQYDIAIFNTEPGDVIVNHLLTVHAAPGNYTDRRRRAVSFRFGGDDARFAVRSADFRLKPLWDTGLEPGDPFPANHKLFPQVWPRS